MENSLFNEVAVSMMIYFDASTLDPKTGGQIEIFMHGESVLKTSIEESPVRTEKCSLFWNGQMGHIRVVSQSFRVTDIRAVLSVGFQGVARFGVGDVKLYSIKKTMAGENSDAGKVVALDGTGSQ